MRTTILSLALALSLSFVPVAQDSGAVRVWEGELQLPTYLEDAANPNPPFDLFTFGRYNYPYPLREALTDRREPITWRALYAENEYLKLTVLPDLGGHIYSCIDKRTGREMFYANRSIKKALIGYRGAWAALGVEFNFPVSHNWMSMSPVDYAIVPNPDGSASIWVGNTDQVYRSRWRVELRLEPGRAALEQRVELYNASDVRHRYYWWSNGAVQVWDDSRLVYPTERMATHGFTSIVPWPVDREGRDLSVIRNQTDGPVSLFTHGTREGFVGVYHPRTGSGTVHVADPAELPTHKVWSWGYDRDAAAWRTALSDDDSAYIELQAGLFRNQETYAFLEPQESVRFTEYWLPVRDLGGITRANADAIVHVHRPTPTGVQLSLDVARELPSARITVRQGESSLLDARVTISPRQVWRTEFKGLSSVPVRLDLTDGDGKPVLTHTEGVFAIRPADDSPGPQANEPSPRTTARSAGDYLDAGTLDELEGRRLTALATYRAGLREHPASTALLKAAGRLAVVLGWAEADTAPGTTPTSPAGGRAAASNPGGTDATITGRGAADQALAWLRTAHARNTTDSEVQYYLGLALQGAGREREAQGYLESARRFKGTRAAAAMRLVAWEEPSVALQRVEEALVDAPRASILGALHVSLLRRAGRRDDALAQALHWRTIDPAESLLRYELTLLGRTDTALWTHLAADANRVLDLCDYYFTIGNYTDAVALLDREYPRVEAPMREPGAVAPGDSPLVAYYLAYARERMGSRSSADYARARALSPAYVFPNRRSSHDVLVSALRTDTDDQLARFLLGSWYLGAGLVQPAITAWQRARTFRPAFPTLHRNLGLALLHGRADVTHARAVLEEGTRADPENVEIYLALDGVLSALDAEPRARVDALRRFPSDRTAPSQLVYKLALALAEAGEGERAERLFHERFFPREEGGTNVRAVYVQVRLTSARTAALRGHCTEALRILDTLTAEQSDLAFTHGGLADALASPAMTYQRAEVEQACGRSDAAKETWTRLERSHQAGPAPLLVAIADLARTRLGRPRTPEWRRSVDEALVSIERTLASGSASNPGTLEHARALLLTASGRTADARRALDKVFLLPDRNLSHALARAIAVAR